jgi:hypothetical protein
MGLKTKSTSVSIFKPLLRVRKITMTFYVGKEII